MLRSDASLKLIVLALGHVFCFSAFSAETKNSKVPLPIELTFQKSLAFNDKSMSIDGQSFAPVSCAQVDDAPPFATVRLDQTTAELYCQDGYMGGISILVQGQPKKNLIVLSQKDGDAGDVWDIRSSLFKTEKGSFRIMTEALSSHVDFETETPTFLGCEASVSTFDWNGPKKSFVQSPPSKSGARSFSSPIHVDKQCLDGKGLWAPKKIYKP